MSRDVYIGSYLLYDRRSLLAPRIREVYQQDSIVRIYLFNHLRFANAEGSVLCLFFCILFFLLQHKSTALFFFFILKTLSFFLLYAILSRFFHFTVSTLLRPMMFFLSNVTWSIASCQFIVNDEYLNVKCFQNEDTAETF